MIKPWLCPSSTPVPGATGYSSDSSSCPHVAFGFNDVILAALKQKIAKLPQMSRLVCLVMDEMVIKNGLAYNESRDCVKGFTEQHQPPLTHSLSGGPLLK